MLKKLSKRLILAMILFTLLSFLSLYCLPLVYTNQRGISTMSTWLLRNKTGFMIYHGLFYWVFFCTWPLVVRHWVKQSLKPIQPLQIRQALSIRYYFLGFFLLLELITFWR